jgi:hypothetical protein
MFLLNPWKFHFKAEQSDRGLITSELQELKFDQNCAKKSQPWEAERATKYRRQFSLLSRVARWYSSGNTRAPPPTKLPLLTLLIDARSARGNNTISNNGARGARIGERRRPY